jgi:hypothetical protein
MLSQIGEGPPSHVRRVGRQLDILVTYHLFARDQFTRGVVTDAARL